MLSGRADSNSSNCARVNLYPPTVRTTVSGDTTTSGLVASFGLASLAGSFTGGGVAGRVAGGLAGWGVAGGCASASATVENTIRNFVVFNNLIFLSFWKRTKAAR